MEELVGFLGVIYPKKEGKKSISIRGNELFVSKRTLSDKYTGYTAVVLAIIQRKKVMII